MKERNINEKTKTRLDIRIQIENHFKTIFCSMAFLELMFKYLTVGSWDFEFWVRASEKAGTQMGEQRMIRAVLHCHWFGTRCFNYQALQTQRKFLIHTHTSKRTATERLQYHTPDATECISTQRDKPNINLRLNIQTCGDSKHSIELNFSRLFDK